MMLNKSEYKVDSHLQAGVSLQLRFFSSAVWNTNEEETKHVIRVHFHISDAQNQTEPNRTTQPPPADWAVTSGEFRATLVRISRSLNGVVLLTLAQFLFSDPHFYFQEVDAVARQRRWSLIWKSAPSQKHTTWSWETLRRKTDVHVWLKETIWPTGSLRCDPVRQLDSDLQRSSELQRSPRCCRQRVGGNFSFPLLQQQPILLIAEAFTTIINRIIQKSANLLNNLL